MNTLSPSVSLSTSPQKIMSFVKHFGKSLKYDNNDDIANVTFVSKLFTGEVRRGVYDLGKE